MKSVKCHIDKFGRMSLPSVIREKLNIKKGGIVSLDYTDRPNVNIVTLSNPYNPEKARAILAKYDTKNLLLEDFLAYRKEDEKNLHTKIPKNQHYRII